MCSINKIDIDIDILAKTKQRLTYTELHICSKRKQRHLTFLDDEYANKKHRDVNNGCVMLFMQSLVQIGPSVWAMYCTVWTYSTSIHSLYIHIL